MLKETMINLGTWASVIDEDGVIWFSNFDFNGLFKFDTNEGQMSFVCHFKGVDIDTKLSHIQAFLIESKIVFIPNADTCIRIYDKKSGIMSSVDLPEEERNCEYTNAFMYENKIYFLASDYKMLVFDINYNTVFVDKELTELVKNNLIGGKDYIRRLNNGYVFLIDSKTNSFILIDIRNKEVSSNKINAKCKNVINMLYLDESIWILQDKISNVFSRDNTNKSFIEYKSENDDWLIKEKGVAYYKVAHVNGKLWLPGYYLNGMYSLNKEKKIVERVFDYPEGFRVINNSTYGSVFTNVHYHNNKIYCVPQRGNMIMVCSDDGVLELGLPFWINADEIEGISLLMKSHFYNDITFEGGNGEISNLNNLIDTVS